MKFLVTGAAGFIGNFVAEQLCLAGHQVVGIDNLNDYYNPQIKHDRLARLANFEQFSFIKMDIADREAMAELFASQQFQRVIHLAAQAGVRYSLENPMAYLDSNLNGFMTILEGCRQNKVEHLVYASSSSVYGNQQKIPFSESDQVDHPVSLYAATKKSNELMAHSYSHLYNLPTTGLRFFTVYGPFGRPDMAPWLFTDAILNGRPIKVFNQGNLQRDFTYIDDIVTGVVKIQDVIPLADSVAPYKVYNIGNHTPVKLMSFIQAVENACGIEANKQMLPMQPGDVETTYADVQQLQNACGFKPDTELSQGMQNFVNWFRNYHNI